MKILTTYCIGAALSAILFSSSAMAHEDASSKEYKISEIVKSCISDTENKLKGNVCPNFTSREKKMLCEEKAHGVAVGVCDFNTD